MLQDQAINTSTVATAHSCVGLAGALLIVKSNRDDIERLARVQNCSEIFYGVSFHSLVLVQVILPLMLEIIFQNSSSAIGEQMSTEDCLGNYGRMLCFAVQNQSFPVPSSIFVVLRMTLIPAIFLLAIVK